MDRRRAYRRIRRHRLRPVLVHRARAQPESVPAGPAAGIHVRRADARGPFPVPLPEGVLAGEHVPVRGPISARDRAFLAVQLHVHDAEHLNLDDAEHLDKHDSIVRLVFASIRIHVIEHVRIHTGIPVGIAAWPEGPIAYCGVLAAGKPLPR
jgi:hypothetical protein